MSSFQHLLDRCTVHAVAAGCPTPCYLLAAPRWCPRPGNVTGATAGGLSEALRPELTVAGKWQGTGFAGIFWREAFDLSAPDVLAELLPTVFHEVSHEFDRDRRLKFVGSSAEFRRQLRHQLANLARSLSCSQTVDLDHSPRWVFRTLILAERHRLQTGRRLNPIRLLNYCWRAGDCQQIERTAGREIQKAALNWRNWLKWPVPRIIQDLWLFHHVGSASRPLPYRKMEAKCRVSLAS